MLGADVAKSDCGLGFFTAAFNVDDDTFSEGWVLYVVANAQSKQLRIRGLRGKALASCHRCIDHALTMRGRGFTALRIVLIGPPRTIRTTAAARACTRTAPRAVATCTVALAITLPTV